MRAGAGAAFAFLAVADGIVSDSRLLAVVTEAPGGSGAGGSEPAAAAALAADAVTGAKGPAQPPPSAALVPQSVGGPRISTYAKKDAIGLGAQLLSDGTLDRVVFTLAMFPKLVTSTPSVETIKEKEVTHILDTVFEMTFTKFGCVYVDLIYRMHCGQKLRLLFPNLPTRGGKLGANRKFDEMLKWRFGNQRKSAVDGKIPYKAGMVLDRINLCDAAIELVEEMNFPVTMVNEGKLETKFSDYLSHASGLPASVAANSTADAAAMPVAVAVPYFGSAPFGSAPFGSAFGSATLPLPPRQPTQGSRPTCRWVVTGVGKWNSSTSSIESTQCSVSFSMLTSSCSMLLRESLCRPPMSKTARAHRLTWTRVQKCMIVCFLVGSPRESACAMLAKKSSIGAALSPAKLRGRRRESRAIRGAVLVQKLNVPVQTLEHSHSNTRALPFKN